MAIAGILAAAVLIALMEVPSLMRKRYKKEMWVFCILLLLGTGLSIAQSLDMNIPNPFDWITAVYKPLSDSVERLLK